MGAPTALAVCALLLAPLGVSPGHADEASWRVVVYDGPIAAEEAAFLRSVADSGLDFVPPFGYLARLSPESARGLLARPAVVAVDDVPVGLKASRALDASAGAVRLLVFPEVDARAFAARLVAQGAASARVPGGTDTLVDVQLGGLTVAHLLAQRETRWVEPLRTTLELDNARASAIVQGGADDAWPLHDAGIDGSSQVVGYCDTGLDTDAPLRNLAGRAVHAQFADPDALIVHNAPFSTHRKVAVYYSPVDARGLRGDVDDDHGHGTHVAGTLAGDAGAWGARDGHDGVAFGARLAVCDLSTEQGFHLAANASAYWRPAFDAGARVHSNSWGTTPSDEYTLAARDEDAYAWEHRDFLIVRSMGNDGPAGLMRPEAVAKNVLAIGATRNDAANGSVMEYSARGPASDGRVKPDLVVPGGGCVLSAGLADPAAYRCSEGTSQATAVAAGAATLVRDLYAKGRGPSAAPHHASSALVRATLIASANAVAAPAPDAVEGWGRPQLDSVLDGLVLAQDEGPALATGDAWSTSLVVAEGASLRIVLAWTDHPGALGASIALVNDLDLEVVAPGGEILRGNADLAAVADRANVVERALVGDAESGTYVVRVRGWNVPMGPQPFALVAVATA